MGDPGDTILGWAQHASASRRLHAYGVAADGTRKPIVGDVVVVELDAERALMISLSERVPGEGLAICSLPPAQRPSEPSRFSTLVMRPGGANLLHLSPELHPRREGPTF